MEIVYAVDLKLKNDGVEFDRLFAMDISSQNILAFSCHSLPASDTRPHLPELVSA